MKTLYIIGGAVVLIGIGFWLVRKHWPNFDFLDWYNEDDGEPPAFV
jgi:hypothetical protein